MFTRPLACSADCSTFGRSAYQYYVHTMNETKSAAIQLRIKPSLKAAAAKAAARDHRSLSSLIDKLLTEYLQKARYLKPKK
jgi:hypothetical protein